jgi:hypothetical protein
MLTHLRGCVVKGCEVAAMKRREELERVESLIMSNMKHK